MSIFSGNLHSRKKEYHVYSTNDFALAELGLSNYTLSSISGYLTTNTATKNPDVEDFFGSLGAVKTALTKPTNFYILHFDPASLTYIQQDNNAIFINIKDDGTSATVADNLEKFLEIYDKALTQSGPTIGGVLKSDILDVAKKIQGSYSGCITFTTSYQALGCDNTPLIKLYVLDKENASDDRVVASKGAPIIVDIPKRTTGAEYGRLATNVADIGIYQNASEGGINNPANSVAAPLDIRFNKTTGRWQGGTHQILARLSTDVDSANTNIVKGFNPNLSAYDPSSSNYVGQFSVGKAVPLSMENGNPYMYGPNFIGCSGSQDIRKIEEILVVNRSNRPFKAGDIVLASHIEGEWIIQGFDSPDLQPKTGIGRWQFQKYIVDTDNFFKDYRFQFETSETENPHSNNILPDTYVAKIRLKYYCQLYLGDTDPASKGSYTPDIAKYNIFPDLEPDTAIAKEVPPPEEYDIVLSNQYYQSSIFDQLSCGLGGTSVGNLLGRTNIRKTTSPNIIDDTYPLQRDIPNFWGPMFPNGYTSNSASILKNKQQFKIVANNTNQHKFFCIDQKLSLKDDDYIIAENARMFADEDDSNLSQLPAEVALNGSWIANKFAYPIEKISITAEQQDGLISFFHYFLSNKERFSYLQYEEDDDDDGGDDGGEDGGNSGTGLVLGDLYGLVPNRPNIIQFSPLQLEFALSAVDVIPAALAEGQRYVELNYRTKFAHSFYKEDASSAVLFGTTFADRNSLSTVQLQVGDNPSRGTAPFLFGPWTTRAKETIAPLGGVDIIPTENLYPYEKSNLIGIIASKNSFSANPGTVIYFKTDQNFGLPPQVTLAGGQGPNVTILGPFLAWNTPANPIQQNSVVQWGDRLRSDDIDSVGTTALHVQIFDAWPPAQTFFDGRYFAVLHFNPFVLGGDKGDPSEADMNMLRAKYGARLLSASRKSNGVLSVSLSGISGTVDEQETEVDIREPTYDTGVTIPLETKIIATTSIKPKNLWNINPIRRGKLLSGGGFRYFYTTIGINPDDIVIENGGVGYAAGDKIFFPGKAVLEVVKVNNEGTIVSYNILDRGMDLSPTSFMLPGLKNTFAETSAGEGAIILIKSGKAYPRFGLDEGPQKRSQLVKLTLDSNSGQTAAEGKLVTSITIDGGNGKYDAFYFMHNDILHTICDSSAFTAGFAQYVVLEIGSS